MSADHHHSGFEIPPDPAGRPIDHELLGKFVGAAFDRCTSCQNALLTVVVEDPAAIARLVGWTCVSTHAAFGGLPVYLIDDGVPGPATPEFRQLARLAGAATAMISACEQMTSYQRRCAVHTAIDILVDNLHLSRRQSASTS